MQMNNFFDTPISEVVSHYGVAAVATILGIVLIRNMVSLSGFKFRNIPARIYGRILLGVFGVTSALSGVVTWIVYKNYLDNPAKNAPTSTMGKFLVLTPGTGWLLFIVGALALLKLACIIDDALVQAEIKRKVRQGYQS